MMKNFFGRFRTLQWKLTLSYTWVTTAVSLALFILFFIALLGLLQIFLNEMTPSIQAVLQPVRTPIAQFLAQTPPDIDGLRAWLDSAQQKDEFQVDVLDDSGNIRMSGVVFAAVVAADGRLLAIEPGDNLNQSVPDLLFAQALPAYERALQGETDPRQITAVQENSDAVFITVPVLDEDDRLLAVFLTVIDFSDTAQSTALSPNTWLGILPLVLILFGMAAFVGTIFGFIASRGFSRRLHHLSETAVLWSEGDFSAYVQDNSGDEIGQLGRRLNQMAEQLQNMIQTRSELATLEERNRLARDLHDSVKQQVFATAMQLGAAQTMLDDDPDRAKIHLREAEQLARQAQQELTGLIQELRPAALAGQGLVEALRGYSADWSRRTNIVADLTLLGERPLPLTLEQPLFRVAQEALANVARHSDASRVNLHLAWQAGQFRLTIADDGRGFDPAAIAYGVGLNSMQERLTGINGRLTVESKPDQGTAVTAVVPLE